MRFRPALIAAALAASAALAAEPPSSPQADPAKGRQVATQGVPAKGVPACAACHGADGNSIAPANPKLAGQIPEYLAKQLANFQPGKENKPAERPSSVMGAFAASLSPDQMRDVSAYYASQKLIPDRAKDKSTIELGRKIFRAGIADKAVPACAGCHGPAGAGIPIQYPHLAGQYAEYIEVQLKAFRSGERANDPNRMMRTTASRLSDAEIKAVADYIAGLR
jgi:cytochrome c553